MKRGLLLVGLLATVATLGCAVPNRAIRSSYTGYNETIQFNQNQQMLLNLVRLKYRESPLFLKVGALSASYTSQVNAGINVSHSGGSTPYGVNLGGSFSDRPTITYTPLEGNTFVKQVLAEVSAETFVLLYRSGWPMRTLCHVLVEQIGDSKNDEDDPSYERFSAVVEILHKARKEDRLTFVTTVDNVLMLKLHTDRRDLVSDKRLPHSRDMMIAFSDFQLRSFLDVLFFLAKNTEVPAEHVDRVRPSPKNGWLTIRSSPQPPKDALVWVEHQGWYFSIPNSDVDAKDTFALVKLLFQIQAGDIKTVQPILTLPLAQPG
jgi:hypothetical protein